MSSSPSHELLSIQDIQLDKSNPRIQRYLAMYGDDVTAEQLHLALGVGGDAGQGSETGTTFYSLQESIRTSGTIIQPIHVNREPDGTLVVIEGNTRAAIYREFLDNDVEGNWSRIPSIVYDNLSQEEIDSIRLQSHLVGPRAWDPYSKARYLNKLHNEQDMPLDRLTDLCGGRKREVIEYINAYNDMEKFYRPILDSDGDFDPTRFSGFVELQKRSVKDAILHAGYDISDFSKWVNDSLIDPLNTVRILPKILKNERLTDVFLNEGAREAQRQLDRAVDNVNLEDAELKDLCRAVTVKLRGLPWADVKRMQDNSQGDDATALFDLADELNSLIEGTLSE